MASNAGIAMVKDTRAMLHLYRKLLRSSSTYPSKNRWGIYKAIQEDFRENVSLDPEAADTQRKITLAYKGLEQLRMYDEHVLSGGRPGNPNWSVTLDQNPMPKPHDYERKGKK
eukprot:scaffold83272_cov55-Attheya_sp.AAC.5